MKLTFRIDDVSANTDLKELRRMIKVLRARFVCEIWLCVNPFSLKTVEGSVYPGVPFKDKDKEFFYNVNQYIEGKDLKLGQDKIVSHGLFHADHSRLQYDAQKMSIVGSCSILKTDIFVPPFNRLNDSTIAICKHNMVRLIKSYDEGWRSLEHEPFDLSHQLWYFHPWRFNVLQFDKVLDGKSYNVA